jgi:hypothetical protein
VSYSQENHRFALRGITPVLAAQVVLQAPPPSTASWAGRSFRLQTGQDAVSKELRLFSVHVEEPGDYSPYMLMNSGQRVYRDRRIFTERLETKSRAGLGTIKQLVEDGRARELHFS